MAMKSLVTGGAGFIGSHVARHCLNQGHEVVVLDDLSGGFADNVPTGAAFVRGSITDRALVKRLFAEHGFDYVYHLAAYAAEGLSHFIRCFNYENNLIGTMNLVNAAVNAGCVRRFVFTSSIAVYGAGQTPMTEATVPHPEDPYGISKYAAELDLKAAHGMFGLDYTILRPHNVYGENQNMGDRYRNVIGIFLNQILQGEPMTVFGDGLQTRAFTYIDDVAPVIARCVDVPGARNEVFNVGAENPTSVLELGRVLAASMGVEPRFQHLAARNEVVHAFSSHAKLHDVFGRQAYTPLAEGIARNVAWARLKGSRKTPIFTGVEVLKNMPPSWRQAFSA
jgi:UDP-glucose 4-epimerase